MNDVPRDNSLAFMRRRIDVGRPIGGGWRDVLEANARALAALRMVNVAACTSGISIAAGTWQRQGGAS